MRTEVVKVRVNPVEKLLLKQRAEREGLSVSDLVRRRTLGEHRKARTPRGAKQAEITARTRDLVSAGLTLPEARRKAEAEWEAR